MNGEIEKVDPADKSVMVNGKLYEGECFVEIGGSIAGYAKGNFYNEPLPDVKLRKPSIIWHWGKVERTTKKGADSEIARHPLLQL